MSPQPGQPGTGPAQDFSARTAGPRTRLSGVEAGVREGLMSWFVITPTRGMNFLLIPALAGLLAMLMLWTRAQPLLAPGMLAPESRLVRTAFTRIDDAATAVDRDTAAKRAPRVYVSNEALFDEIITSLTNLPRVVAGAESLSQLTPEWRVPFALTEPLFRTLRERTGTPEGMDLWQRRVTRLESELRRMAIVDSESSLAELAAINERVVLVRADAESRPGALGPAELEVRSAFVFNAAAPEAVQALRNAAATSGFSGDLLEVVAGRLTYTPGELLAPPSPATPAADTAPSPPTAAAPPAPAAASDPATAAAPLRQTYRFDPERTRQRQDAEARAVPDRTIQYPAGYVIYARGEVLTDEKLALAMHEHRNFRASTGALQWWLEEAGVLGMAVLAALATVMYTGIFATPTPGATGSGAPASPGSSSPGGLPAGPAPATPLGVGAASRRLQVAAVLIAGLSASALIAVVEPRAVLVAMTAPIVLSVMILAIAFDRRMALGVGSLMALLACICLYQPAATSAVSIAGLACAAMRLRDVHSRRAPISAGLWSGLGTFIAIVLLGSLLRPIADGAIQQTVIDAAVAAGFCILAGVIVLACIPLIERIFGITTGMTLVELRDPRHPLLRQLQQRAPGTYNHSLNVASLAETAADAIGADPLLAYVGALYHDVGKLNKPEYFVENQTPGINRHEKLAPATSLLVIVGHVRDGAELAREYNLPASLIHFIESHHGTTLVEYFYHRARKQAEAAGIRSGEQLPQEIEYRYPGPKPATREAAILMICDASESAARTLTDPTPMKLESLVRAIAHKRLMDGQFDASGLTLTDIHKIVDAVSRTLAAINHQRLAYPEPDRPKPPPAPPANPALTGSPSAANSGPAPQTGPLISTPVG